MINKRPNADFLRPFFRPSSKEEREALYLEEKLQNLQSYASTLQKRIKAKERKDLDATALREKLKEIQKSINETFSKANTAWSTINNQTKRINK